MAEIENEGGGASRSTDPASGTSAATDVSLREYVTLDKDWQWRFLQERDRRYMEVEEERDRRYREVQVERDKAEVIRAATQAYRDEKANELREQLASERLDYASKGDLTGAIETITATLEPIVRYVAGQQGGRQGALDQRSLVAWAAALIFGAIAVFVALNN